MKNNRLKILVFSVIYWISIGCYSQTLSYKDSVSIILTESKDSLTAAGKLHRLALRHSSDYDFTVSTLKKAVYLYQRASDYEEVIACRMDLFNILINQRHKQESFEQLVLARKAAQKHKDKKWLMSILFNFGVFFNSEQEYQDALPYFYDAYQIAVEVQDSAYMPRSLVWIGVVYYYLNQLDSAKTYYQKALDLAKAKKDTPSIAYAIQNIGFIYKEKNNFDEAYRQYKKSLKLFFKINDSAAINHTYMVLAEILQLSHKIDEAILMCDTCIMLAKKRKALSYLVNCTDDLAENYAIKGDYDKAYNFQRQYSIYKDSLVTLEKAKELQDAVVKYKSEQMKLEYENLKLQKKRDEEKALMAQRKKNQIIGSIGVFLGIVIVFSLIMANRYRLIKSQKQIIENQKQLVEQKNKEVTDSIRYAKRIQTAILPPERIIKEHLPQSFVFYKPKDIVSGDFYWLETIGNQVFFAVADCTGHGVPGAMVSVVCSNAFSKAVIEEQLYLPGKILSRAKHLIVERFARSGENIYDGMDISLCVLNKDTLELQWSGANNPLYIIRSGDLMELKPDKQPVGKSDVSKPFTTHTVQLQPGDTLYLFTDGFADQFGGPKGKKFKYKPFKELLIAISTKPMSEQQQILHDTFEKWKGNLEQVDDVCIFGVRI